MNPDLTFHMWKTQLMIILAAKQMHLRNVLVCWRRHLETGVWEENPKSSERKINIILGFIFGNLVVVHGFYDTALL